jgi:hypothetical protein
MWCRRRNPRKCAGCKGSISTYWYILYEGSLDEDKIRYCDTCYWAPHNRPSHFSPEDQFDARSIVAIRRSATQLCSNPPNRGAGRVYGFDYLVEWAADEHELYTWVGLRSDNLCTLLAAYLAHVLCHPVVVRADTMDCILCPPPIGPLIHYVYPYLTTCERISLGSTTVSMRKALIAFGRQHMTAEYLHQVAPYTLLQCMQCTAGISSGEIVRVMGAVGYESVIHSGCTPARVRAAATPLPRVATMLWSDTYEPHTSGFHVLPLLWAAR